MATPFVKQIWLNGFGQIGVKLYFIPNYYMQVAWLPQSTCESIDEMAQNFLWKGSSNSGIHLVG